MKIRFDTDRARDLVGRAATAVRVAIADARPAVRAVRAVTNTVTSVAASKSPAGVVSAVADGIVDLHSALSDSGPQNRRPLGVVPVPLSMYLPELRRRVQVHGSESGNVFLYGLYGGAQINAVHYYDTHMIVATEPSVRATGTLLRDALSSLPQALSLASSRGGWSVSPIDLAHVPLSIPAAEIWRLTAPLVDGHGSRGILINGKPGVGKTTAALAIAREASRVLSGRVLVLPSSVLEGSDHGYPLFLDPLTPSVVVVDDIDKVILDLGSLERMRAASKLLILTANNGASDDVFDAATIRPARAVDEMFDLAGEERRAPPFDKLPDDVWRRIHTWPVAYQNEAAARFAARGANPDQLRLDDLEQRLNRRTRSGAHLGDLP